MAVSSLDKRVKTATKRIAIAGNITFKPLPAAPRELLTGKRYCINGNVLKFVPDEGK